MNRLRDVVINEWEVEEDLISIELEDIHFLIKRHPKFGFLVGYVGVTVEHPYFLVDSETKEVRAIKCHEGITWTGNDQEGMKEKFWYFGFDCAHITDYIPNLTSPFFQGETKELDKINEVIGFIIDQPGFSLPSPKDYKSMSFVMNELQKIYGQLNAISKKAQ